MRGLRDADPHAAGGGARFFVSGRSLLGDAFFLAYGGLHWGFEEVRRLPLRTRSEFVGALERQLDFEREQMRKNSR